MEQKTLLALGALGAIALATFLTLRAPEKGQRVGPPPRPIAALKATDIKELELTSSNGKDHVVLKYDGNKWALTVPGNFPADQSMVKTAIDQLEKVSFGDIVTENAAKFGDLEVNAEKGAHVVAKDGASKVLFDAWMGKATAGFTMLRPAAKNEVWQAGALTKYTFARDAKGWRDHTVFEFGREDVTQLTVEAGGEKLRLEKIPPADKNADAKWKVAEGSVKVDPLDDSVANNLVQSLAGLRAADFDDTAKPADVGLAPPKSKVTATVKGQPVVLLVGHQKGDDSWVAVEGKPQIYLLQKYTVERLAVIPHNFRDKTIVKAKEADLTEISLTSGGETWVLNHEGTDWKSPKGELDPSKVRPLVSAFEEFKGESFAESKNNGLTKPTGSVMLKLRDGGTMTLKVGAAKDSDYFVQKVGSPEVLMVKKFQVDRFLKKFSDLSKTTTAAK